MLYLECPIGNWTWTHMILSGTCPVLSGMCPVLSGMCPVMLSNLVRVSGMSNQGSGLRILANSSRIECTFTHSLESVDYSHLFSRIRCEPICALSRIRRKSVCAFSRIRRESSAHVRESVANSFANSSRIRREPIRESAVHSCLSLANSREPSRIRRESVYGI